MIVRIWHGWTRPEDADLYEQLLLGEIVPGIEARRVAGYHGIEVLRRSLAHEVEFVTVMRFDTLDAVRGFAGPEYDVAVVPPRARALLARFDERAAHYETRPAGASAQ